MNLLMHITEFLLLSYLFDNLVKFDNLAEFEILAKYES